MKTLLYTLLLVMLIMAACGDDSGEGTNDDTSDDTQSSDTDDEDVGEDMGDPELASIDGFVYAGSFRFTNGDFGASNVNYAIGVLAYNPENHSLFIAGCRFSQFCTPQHCGIIDVRVAGWS